MPRVVLGLKKRGIHDDIEAILKKPNAEVMAREVRKREEEGCIKLKTTLHLARQMNQHEKPFCQKMRSHTALFL